MMNSRAMVRPGSLDCSNKMQQNTQLEPPVALGADALAADPALGIKEVFLEEVGISSDNVFQEMVVRRSGDMFGCALAHPARTRTAPEPDHRLAIDNICYLRRVSGGPAARIGCGHGERLDGSACRLATTGRPVRFGSDRGCN
jgi:hypothetical protein